MSLGESLETGSGIPPDIPTSRSAVCKILLSTFGPNIYSLYYTAFISVEQLSYRQYNRQFINMLDELVNKEYA